MDIVCERDSGAEHSESSCSLDLRGDKTLLSTVLC